MQINWSLEIAQALAVKEASAAGFRDVEPEHLIMGVTKFAEMPGKLLEMMPGLDHEISRLSEEQRQIVEFLREHGQDSAFLRRLLRKVMGRGDFAAGKGQPLPSSSAFILLKEAGEQARSQGADYPGAVDLLKTAWMRPPTLILKKYLTPTGKFSGKDANVPVPTAKEKNASSFQPPSIDLADLTARLKQLRAKLRETILGQDHAITAFIEGLFNAEATAAADSGRKRPKGLFVFAGPPGVGKTFLAETGAGILARPFLRLDMSGYADAMGVIQLVGAQRSYQGAKQGKMTGFVKENPDAILLFDEIEKAGLEVIHLFLQLLDNGALEDKFTEQNVEFKDTIVIFTTNAGKTLYEDGVTAGTVLHRRTILSALEQEIDPRTRKPFFPQAICSRMATGYPVMFNRLGVTELVQIAAKEMDRVGKLFEAAHGKTFIVDPAVPLCLLLREGAKTDARTIRSQAEIFCKSEFFNLLRHMSADHLQETLEKTKRIHFYLDAENNPDATEDDAVLLQVFRPAGKPKVLAAARADVIAVLEKITAAEIDFASDINTAKTLLTTTDFDVILIDPWLEEHDILATMNAGMTIACFDKAPIAAKSLRRGIELLRMLHDLPESPPVYLLSLAASATDDVSVDDELMISAARYGSKGVLSINTSGTGRFDPAGGICSEEELRWFEKRLEDTAVRLRREQAVAELGSQGKVLAFDTSPGIFSEGEELAIRLRGLRLMNAPAADDVGGLIGESERPAMSFDDVFGADQAKAELKHIVDWLKEPRKFSGLGLKPPKGVLLYGPPGTGKTLLARALAGESDAAFIVESATSFVTKFQGSGPENVRNLFARGRRYAPSIVFIDEIDAVGKKREGAGFNRAQEETLNAILTEMDGFSSPATKPVIVIAATNLVDKLDPALIRRFDREVEVDKPDKSARLAFLHKRLAPGPHCRVSEVVMERMARQSAGDTIANLERAIRTAGRRAAQATGVITDAVMEESFETMRMGDAKGTAPDRETLLRVARHEAGHCLVGWLQGDRPMQITIVARGRAGGYVEREAQEDKMIYLKSDLENAIRQCMAGRAAEIIYYGEECGLSSGVSGDLQQASRLAENMVCHYGMSDRPGQVSISDAQGRKGPLALTILRAKERIVSEQLARARTLLEKHRPLMDTLVEMLMEKNRLTREDLEKILPE